MPVYHGYRAGHQERCCAFAAHEPCLKGPRFEVTPRHTYHPRESHRAEHAILTIAEILATGI